jgi:hypothetical protein
MATKDDEVMFECGYCAAMTTRLHKTRKDCFMALSREVESRCSRIVYLLHHIKEDDEIREMKNRVTSAIRI